MSAVSIIDDMAARGRHHFTTQEAASLLGSSVPAARAALRRLREKGRVAAPYRGFHVIVPPEYRRLGCLPADQLVPQLMGHLGLVYYAALLTAGRYHGAAHQQPQVFQVMVGKNRPAITCGEVRVAFAARSNISQRDPDHHDQHAARLSRGLDARSDGFRSRWLPQTLRRSRQRRHRADRPPSTPGHRGRSPPRARLDPWLGTPRRAFKTGRVVLVYRMRSEGPAPLPMRLKIEINSREHFSVFDLVERPFQVRSRWFSGGAVVKTYELDKLLGTKLRALYQRKKGRDLFDLWTASRMAGVDPERVITCFGRYLDNDGLRVSRAEFERNMAAKLVDETSTRDIEPLLAPRAAWNLNDAARYAQDELIARLPGDALKGVGVDA